MSIPNRASDAGPDSGPDPADRMDAYDWLIESRELNDEAKRAMPGGDRLEAMRRAHEALSNAITLTERDILRRWLAVGRTEIDPALAQSKAWREELAQDMRALGWQLVDGKYKKPVPR